MSEYATKEQIVALQAQVVAYATLLGTLINKLTEDELLSIQERQALFSDAAKELRNTYQDGDTITRLAIQLVDRLGDVGNQGYYWMLDQQ